MKYFIGMTSIIGLILLSQFANSAPITDTYVTGDTLTAAKMNHIKSAVNDNDTKIGNKQNRVADTCPVGQSIRVINEDGSITCQSNSVGALDFGSVLSVVDNTTTTPAQTATATASCTTGAYATGGSCVIATATDSGTTLLKTNEPTVAGVAGPPDGWLCACQAASGQTCTVTATAICAQ